jgi:RNA polymerase-binding protein DksA
MSVAPLLSVTARQIERFRRILIERLTELYRGVHSEIRDSTIRHAFEQDEPRDEVDESQRVQLRDLRVRLVENDSVRAQMMEEALRRMTRREYGLCIDCGNTIGVDRLSLVPWAPRCVDCQESAEIEARQRLPTL